MRFSMFSTSCSVVLAMVSSCSSEQPRRKDEAPGERSSVSAAGAVGERLASSARSETVALRDSDGGKVLVRVNGEDVPESRLKDMVGHLKGRFPRNIYLKEERTATGLIVKDVLVEQFLRQEGYAPTPEEIEAEIDRRRRVYGSSAPDHGVSLAEALRRQGTSIERLREAPTVGMKLSCYVRRSITEEDLVRTFETARDTFDGTEVRASHILFDTRSVSSQAAREQLLDKARSVRAIAVAGDDFARLARENSDCPTRNKGGDLGFFARRGAVPEQVAAAAFALRDGEVSGVITSPLGYHVLKRTGTRGGKAVALDDVRERVTDICAETEAREIYADLRERAKIEWPANERRQTK